MNVLQTVKFYHPSNGGMETVVKNIVEGISAIDPDQNFCIFANNHFKSFRTTIKPEKNITVFKETAPLSV